MSSLINIVAFVALFTLLLIATISDIRNRSIPNWIIAALVCVWAIWKLALNAAGIHDEILGDLFQALVFGAVLLCVVVTAERVSCKYLFGGGDIKLLSAVTLFLGIESMMLALFVSCAVSLIYAASNRIAHSERGIPFAPCLFCGSVFTVLMLV